MDGAQFRQLQAALQSAFPNVASLRILARTGLNENLAAIASENNLSQCTFELIGWAESHGRLEELITQAYLANPGNPELRRFAAPFVATAAKLPETEKPVVGQEAPRVTANQPKERHTEQPPATASFGILHLTDLHYGLKSQERFLPGILVDFFKDLELLHAKSGPWDLVLFSGDLVQSGTQAQFADLQKLLDQIWKRLRELGSPNPILLAVPGNHDLLRPKVTSTVRVLKGLASDPDGAEVWEEILDPASESEYRSVVNQTFAEYRAWWEQCPYRGQDRSDLTYHAGALPGDFSAVLEKDGARLGIVGLNTTFLQLTGDNYEGKLAVDVLQFNKACEGGGAPWFENNLDACVLMTHQPPSWLDASNRDEVFYQEIDWPGRFAAHFCGHMHVPDAATRGSGWSQERRLVRGGSLFGLDASPEGKIERIHAYAACRIEIPADSATGNIRLWPRVAQPRSAGPLQFDRDTKYSLDRRKDDGGTRAQEFDRLRQPPAIDPPAPDPINPP